MRSYELEKVESYAIRARNIDEAMEILNGLDNSSAFRVNVRAVYAGQEEASKCACNECECVIKDDYTKEGGTCEECFRECVSTEGGE